MKKTTLHIIIVIIFGSISIAYSQDQNKSIVKKPNLIFFAPVNLLDPINPSFQMGYERTLNQKWALQVEGAYIINKGLLNILMNPQESRDEYSNKGFKIRFELKRYLKRTHNLDYYSSFELFYLKNKSFVINQYIVSDPSFVYSFGQANDDGQEYYYDDYHLNDKKKYAANIKFGMKFNLESILFETYVGAGIAYRQNTHKYRENMNDKPLDNSFLNDNKPGNVWILNLPINLKIGYKF